MSDYQPGISVPAGEPEAGRATERWEEARTTVAERLRRAEETTRGARQQLRRGAERLRILTATGLARAADTLRGSSAGPESTARRFADSLEQGAAYLRRADLDSMQRDLVGLVRQYPVQALGAAFVTGLLLGRRLHWGGLARSQSGGRSIGIEDPLDM
ncbi:MAG: hypothetical protein K6V36_02900 [Anaerolineae bacterium]|nr:hypothetical protein [Anaerolineae bacterium]